VSILTPPEQWKAQLQTRFIGRDEAFKKARLAEAKESVSWTRQQIISHNPDHAVIINDETNTQVSVRQLTDFANGGTIKTPENTIIIIEQMLDFLETASVAL
jgi:hypothetical protein